MPGPACYGTGGTEPTVTDAALLLGYLDPDYFLGGRLALDTEAARRAVGTLADQLGKSLDDGAHAIMSLANELMIKAIQDITVTEGFNPASAPSSRAAARPASAPWRLPASSAASG